jgi:hypothetical protein
MRLPTAALTFAATASFRTVNRNFSATVPGMVTMAISPSQVLQMKPRRESFCT